MMWFEVSLVAQPCVINASAPCPLCTYLMLQWPHHLLGHLCTWLCPTPQAAKPAQHHVRGVQGAGGCVTSASLSQPC